ncbi:hypothetical protein YB2330_005253 [Saitoella coloradoensis]
MHNTWRSRAQDQSGKAVAAKGITAGTNYTGDKKQARFLTDDMLWRKKNSRQKRDQEFLNKHGALKEVDKGSKKRLDSIRKRMDEKEDQVKDVDEGGCPVVQLRCQRTPRTESVFMRGWN